MKKSFYKKPSNATIDRLDNNIKTRYPFLYSSVGGEYIRNLLIDLYGVSKKNVKSNEKIHCNSNVIIAM